MYPRCPIWIDGSAHILNPIAVARAQKLMSSPHRSIGENSALYFSMIGSIIRVRIRHPPNPHASTSKILSLG